MADWLAAWLVFLLTNASWLTPSLLVNWLGGWLIDCLTHWLVSCRLIDWIQGSCSRWLISVTLQRAQTKRDRVLFARNMPTVKVQCMFITAKNSHKVDFNFASSLHFFVSQGPRECKQGLSLCDHFTDLEILWSSWNCYLPQNSTNSSRKPTGDWQHDRVTSNVQLWHGQAQRYLKRPSQDGMQRDKAAHKKKHTFDVAQICVVLLSVVQLCTVLYCSLVYHNIQYTVSYCSESYHTVMYCDILCHPQVTSSWKGWGQTCT